MDHAESVDGRRAGLVTGGEARSLLAGPLGADLLAGAADTGGAVSFVVPPLAPRTLGSPVHTHTREDEWSYVLEGQVGVRLGDRTVTARPGDLVLKPRGVRTPSGTPPTSRPGSSRSSRPRGSRGTSPGWVSCSAEAIPR